MLLRIMVSLTVGVGLCHGQAAVSATPAATMANVGTPASNGYPCNAGVASSSSSSLYDQRDIVSGNSIWRCKLAPDGVTYFWQAPFNAPVLFNSGGAYVGGKCWNDSVTTSTSGQATVNWSSAGFATVPKVQTQVITNGTAASNAAFVGVSSKTLTGANVTVTVPALAVLSSLSVQLASSAYTIDIQACGT